MPEDYSAYVPHPRFGKEPRYTNINPSEDTVRPYFGWRTQGMIRGTAVRADYKKQNEACVYITHYYDQNRTCIDCAKPFIFYADEQRHWYEELGFSVNADCIRCPICRKQAQAIAKAKRRYEELSKIDNLDEHQAIEMADVCIHLVEIGEFSEKQISHIRAMLNQAKRRNVAPEELDRLKTRIDAIPRKDG